jgi:drug/metabolite transporter (DMT)-like permease
LKNQRLLVHILLISAYAMWGTHGLWIRGIDVPVTTLVFMESAFASLILLPFLIYTKQIKQIASPRNFFVTVGVGALMALTVLALYRALQITTISNGILAHWIAPVLVVLFAPLFLPEKREKIFGFALAIAIGGLVIMTPFEDLSFGNKDLIGIGIALLSAVFFAGSIIATKKIAGSFSPMVMMLGVFIAEIIFTGPIALTDPATLGYFHQYVWLFMAKAVVTAILPFVIYMWSFQKIEAQRVSIIGYMEPLSGVAFAAVFLNEIPGWNTLIGGLMILAAGAWIVLSASRRESRESREGEAQHSAAPRPEEVEAFSSTS